MDPVMLRTRIGATALSVMVGTSARAQPNPRLFAGAVAGIATLSADARSEITPAGADVSLYKPENGPALNVFFGVHLQDYVTVQANYVWNRNDLTLTSVRASTEPALYEQPRTASQHALVGDVLAYFRERRSAVRPYLSVGLGVVRLHTNEAGPSVARGAAVPPTNTLAATRPLMRVAVGMDVALRMGWSARYSFSESLSGNPISAQLSPPGQRNLANFQNLFGLVRTF